MSLELSGRDRWKYILFGVAILVSFFFLWFSNSLVKKLSSAEVEKIEKLAKAYEDIKKLQEESIKNPTLDVDYGPILDTIRKNKIPIIVVDKNDSITDARNISEKKKKDHVYMRSILKQWKSAHDGIKIYYTPNDYQVIYYEEKPEITQLKYFPYALFLFISTFLVIAYVAFNSSRKYEQNKVWVGLAKETAHQIGTPLSSLIAWVDYLKNIEAKPGEEVITELEKDINRLEVITERFSKIGSTPELKPYNMYIVIGEAIDYLKRRISKKVNIHLSENSSKTAQASINRHLFDWVIENLTKNAVDAMNGEGEISFRIMETAKHIYIDVKDTGKGIPRNSFKRVFEPGFTTKKRGWGLGLSLSRRIIENYHNGEIFVKESEPGKGTTFRIKLKKEETPAEF